MCQAYSDNPFPKFKKCKLSHSSCLRVSAVPFIKSLDDGQKFALEQTMKPPKLLEVGRKVAERASAPEKDRHVVELVKFMSQPVCGRRAVRG